MPISFSKKYINQSQYILDLAQTSDLFDLNTYKSYENIGDSNQYASLIAGTLNKTSDTFDKSDYELLSGEDKSTYIFRHYYGEDLTDEQKSEYDTYLDYKVEEAIAENTYNNLNTFQKIIYSVGGFFGNIGVTLAEMTEGLIDAGTFIWEGFTRLAGKVLDYEEYADSVRDFAAQDITGAGAAREEFNDFLKTYTIWDKSTIGQVVLEVEESITKMAPMIIATVASTGATTPMLIKTIGSTLYYGEMAGELYADTISEYPDIDYGNLFGYVASNVALEIATEKLSDLTLGGDTVSRMIFGGTNTKTFLKSLPLNMLSEGLEEAVSESLSPLLYNYFLQPEEAKTFNISDVLHSAIIGALVGGIMNTGELMISPSLAVTSEGTLTTAHEAKTSGADYKKLSKLKSYDTLAKLNSLAVLDTNTNVQALKAKYNMSSEQLEQTHSSEYEKALEADEKITNDISKVTVGLANYMNTIGVKSFSNAVEFLNLVHNNQVKSLETYTNQKEYNTKELSEASKSFSIANPGFNINLKDFSEYSREERFINKLLMENYGVKLYVGDIGSESGLPMNRINTYTNGVYVESGVIDAKSYQDVMENIIHKQLADVVLNTPGLLANSDFNSLLQTLYPDSGATGLTNGQKQMFSQMLLFDEISVAKVFNSNKNIFFKIFNWCKKAILRNRNKVKNDVVKVEYNTLLKIRDRYISTVAHSIGNEIDGEKAKRLMELSDEEYKTKIVDIYKPNILNEWVINMDTNYNTDVTEKMTVESFVFNNRATLDLTEEFDWDRVYDPNYYKDDFVKQITDKYQGETFENALWYYVSDTYGYSISKVTQAIYKQVDLVKYSNTKFLNDVDEAMFFSDPKYLKKYTTLKSILNEKYLSVFDKHYVNNVRIEYSNEMKQAGSYEILVNGTSLIKINVDQAHINNVQEELYHEISHALAYMQGLPTGTSMKEARFAVNGLSPMQYEALAKLMFGDNILNKSPEEIREKMARVIYTQCIGEKYATGKAEDFAKLKDGFMIKDIYIIGLGKYSRVAGMPLYMKLEKQHVLSNKESETSIGNDLKKALDYTNHDAMVDDGMNTDFADLIEDPKTTREDVLEALNNNSIGTVTQTNKVIKYLYPNNKNVKTMANIDNVKAFLYVADIYYKLGNDEKIPLSKMANVVAQTPMDTIIRVKDKKHTLGKYIESRDARIQEYIDNAKNANQIILEMDYDLSEAETKQLIKNLKNNSVKESFKTTTLDIDSGTGEGETVSLADEISYKAYEETRGYEEVEKETLDSVKKRVKNTITSDIKEWLTTTDTRTANINSIKQELQNVVANAKEQGFDLSSYLNKNDLSNTIKEIITDENTFEIMNKLKNNKSFIDEVFGNGTYADIIASLGTKFKSDYSRIVTSLKNKLEKADVTDKALLETDTSNFTPSQFEKYIGELQTALETKPAIKLAEKTEEKVKTEEKPIETKEKVVKTEEKPVKTEEKTITEQEATGEVDSEPVAVEKVIDEKKEINNKIKSDKSILDKSEELLKLFGEEVSSEYGGDLDDPHHVVSSMKIADNNSEFFSNITSEEYMKMYKTLLASALQNPTTDAALNLLVRYGYINRSSQFESIKDLIVAQHQRIVSFGGQAGGGASAIYGTHTVQSFIADMSVNNGVDIELPEEILLNSYGEKHETLNDLRDKLLKELEDDTNRAKNEKDLLLRYMINEEKKTKTRILNAIDEYDIAAALDGRIQQLTKSNENITENLETIQTAYEDIVKYMLEHYEPRKESAFVRIDKKLNKLTLPEKETMLKIWNTIDSIKYIAMLSSPKTDFKNALANTLSSAQAMLLEDPILKFIENRSSIYLDSQVKFTGDYDSTFKDYVYKKYAPLVLADTNSSKYSETDLDELRQEYAKAKDPINKTKILSKIKALEQKLLSDMPWTKARTLRNLTNTFAGSMPQILNQAEDKLKTIYERGKKKSDILSEQLLNKIQETNTDLADLYEKALNGDKIATLQLGEELDIELLSRDKTVFNSLYNHSLYRANKLLLKTDNWYTKARKNLSKSHPILVKVLDWLIPFGRVTVNSTSYILDRSPIGLAKGIIQKANTKKMFVNDMKKNITDYYRKNYVSDGKANNANFKFNRNGFEKWLEQHVSSEARIALSTNKYKTIKSIYDNMVDEGLIQPGSIGSDNIFAAATSTESITQGLVGSGVLLAGFVLAMVTGAFDYDDDDDYLGPVIKIGDFKLALDDIAPFSTMFTIGAMLGSKNIDNRIEAAFLSLVDQSVFNVMDSAIAYSDSLGDFIANQSINTITQFQPAIFKNLTKVIYNAKKDKSGSWGSKLIKTVGSNSLLFASLVPNKINPYTGEVQRYYDTGVFEGLLNNILPLSYRHDVKSDLQKEAERLETGTSGFSGSFTINGTEISVTNKNKEKLAKFRAEYVKNEYNNIVSGQQTVTVEDEKTGKYITTTYDKLTDKQKKNVLTSLYSKATAAAKVKYWTDLGNYYVCTSTDEYRKYKEYINSSNVIYRSKWSDSKYVES